VRNQLTLGTLKLARVRGVTFPRMFSMAYPAGPEPTGNAGSFRSFLLAHALDLAPRVTGRAAKNSPEPPPAKKSTAENPAAKGAHAPNRSQARAMSARNSN
jgi:hypothetical protein